MTPSFDVIVLGAGAWGSAAAQHLALRGSRVLCVDRFRPPHSRGSTHGRSRIITTAAESSPGNLPLILRSYELWRELERATGRRLLQRVGYLYVGSSRSERIRRSLASFGPESPPHEVLSPPEVSRRFPAFRLRPDEVGILDPGGGRLDPEGCVTAALEVAADHGAVLEFGEPALDWTAGPSGVEVVTAVGRRQADWLVLALGAWTPPLSRMELPVWVERQVAVWYGSREADLSGFSFPVEPPATSLYGVPEEGGRVKVAFHHGGERTDPDSVRPVTTADLEAVHRVIAERVPSLTEVVESSTCMYTNTPDQQYAIGRHPSSDRVVVLAGGSGRGFHQAQVIGEFVADHVNGKERADMAWLSPSRFGES